MNPPDRPPSASQIVQPDIFISYASEDLAAARAIRDLLALAGYTAFVAEDDLKLQVGSAPWLLRLEELLQIASVLVLIVTPSALDSSFVQHELQTFRLASLNARRGTVIPVCLDGQGPKALPLYLQSFQCVDARDHASRKARYADVLAVVRGVFGERGQDAGASLRAREVGTSPGPQHSPRSARRSRVAFAGGAIGALSLLGLWRFSFTEANAVPERALRALELYASPDAVALAELRSEDAWEEVQHAFQVASAEPGAPVRWRAAQHFAEAQRELRRGDPTAARSSLERSRDIDPTWALPHVGLSEVLCETQPQLAIEAAKRARALDPGSWLAVLKLGTAYLYDGASEHAIEQYRRALALVPDSLIVKADLALALHSAGNTFDGEAARLAKAVVAVDASIVAAQLVLAEQALDQRNVPAAMTHAQTAATLAPRSPAVQLAIGDALQLAERNDEARTRWASAVQLSRQLGIRGAPAPRLRVVAEALALNRIPPLRPRPGEAVDQAIEPSLRPTPNHSRTTRISLDDF